MAVKYDRLFHLMIDRKIANAQLAEKAGVSANIITRLKRNQNCATRSIMTSNKFRTNYMRIA